MSTTPTRSTVSNDDRTCDRCPCKGTKTIHYAGGEYCLCSDCLDEITQR